MVVIKYRVIRLRKCPLRENNTKSENIARSPPTKKYVPPRLSLPMDVKPTRGRSLVEDIITGQIKYYM